jgi:hypothetical protein
MDLPMIDKPNQSRTRPSVPVDRVWWVEGCCKGMAFYFSSSFCSLDLGIVGFLVGKGEKVNNEEIEKSKTNSVAEAVSG